MGKARYFKLADTEPIVADCIRQTYRRKKKKDWVYHDELVQQLLNDPIGQDLIENAFRRWKLEKHKPQWIEWRDKARNWASNMVQHFSKSGYFNYEKDFERKKDANDAWAYRPRRSA